MPYHKYQFGGGNCSICGASGVTKATCPFNPKAKNPKPAKHNKEPLSQAKDVKKSLKKTKTPSKQKSKDKVFKVNDITKTIPENMESLLDTQVFFWFSDDGGAGLYGSDAFGKIVSRDVKGARDDSPIAWVDANNELSIDYKAGVPYTDKFYIPTEESEKYIKDKEDQIHKGLNQLLKLYKSKSLDSLETTEGDGFPVWKPKNMTLFHFANWDKFSKYLISK